MSYLSEFHPEIFSTLPRPGGIVNIVTPKVLTVSTATTERRTSKGTVSSGRSTKSSRSSRSKRSHGDFSFFQSTPGQTTRNYRINQSLSSTPWIYFDEDEEPDNTLPPDPMHDSMIILAITISTIMLLAAEYKDIPKDHLRWTLSYLECVKDEFDNYPPNVKGILNNIRLIDKNLDSFNEKIELPSDETEGIIEPKENTPEQTQYTEEQPAAEETAVENAPDGGEEDEEDDGWVKV